MILASATDALAQISSREARDTAIEFCPKLFGQSVRKDIRTSKHWQMEAGGSVQAAGVEGDIIGRGARVMIVDDYLKSYLDALSETVRDSQDRWFMATVQSRLTPDGAIVLMATRWHRQDLIGKRLSAMEQGGDQYLRLRLPAIANESDDPLGRQRGEALWPERFTIGTLERLKNSYVTSGYPWMWDALYQQDPPETLDAEWPPSYFGESIWFDEWPHPDDIQFRVIAVDPSLGRTDKSDYSAIVMIVLDRKGTIWVDADLQRRDKYKIAKDVIDYIRWFKPEAVGIESEMWQVMLADAIRTLSKESGIIAPIWEVYTQKIPKIMRIRTTISPYLARGELRFKRRSGGTALLVEQMRMFPTHEHDDGPDALEMAIRLVRGLYYGEVVPNESGEMLIPVSKTSGIRA
jgi:predicted phage terminase large subunit-like protein